MDTQDRINGFSLNFSLALLNKLISLEKEDKIFKKGKAIASQVDRRLKIIEKKSGNIDEPQKNLMAELIEKEAILEKCELTPIAQTVVEHLKAQISVQNPSFSFSCPKEYRPSEIREFIKLVKEFLAIFQ